MSRYLLLGGDRKRHHGGTTGAAPRLRLLLGLLAAAVLATLLWWLRWETSPQHAYQDTYWYARQAATFSGMSGAEAEHFAARTACRYGMPAPRKVGACPAGTRQWADDLPPRYQRIFTTRPGYSLVAAPFVLVAGERGLVLATAALAILAGVLAALVLRLLGGGLFGSLLGTLLLFLLPTGFWVSRLLAEAAATAFALSALGAATLLLRPDRSARARWLAGSGVVAGLLATTVTKPATGLLLSLALTGVALLLTLSARRRRGVWPPGLLVLTAAAGLAATVWLALSAQLDLPGAMETLQDKFTVHFTRPDVSDPWSRLVDLNREFWPAQLNAWWNGGAPVAASPYLALLVVGLLGIWRAMPARVAIVWATAGGTGLLTLLAHPKTSEADRLVLIVWLPVAIGLALLLTRQQPTRPDPTPGGSAGQRPHVPEPDVVDLPGRAEAGVQG